jgi:5-(aminomethyl)-3-furanmethanol phosphate kinase
VPGGGAFADAVRAHDRRFGLRAATAHRMAILAMEQFGRLCDLIPGAVRARTSRPPAPSPRAGARRSSSRRPCSPETRCPASWAVTSDSIAAWVAGAGQAERLVLVKPVGGLYRDRPGAASRLPA